MFQYVFNIQQYIQKRDGKEADLKIHKNSEMRKSFMIYKSILLLERFRTPCVPHQDKIINDKYSKVNKGGKII